MDTVREPHLLPRKMLVTPLGQSFASCIGNGVGCMFAMTISVAVLNKFHAVDVLKANKILPQSPIPFPSPKNSPSPSTRIGGMKDKGKGIKRERDEDHNDGPIEVSDDEDLDVSSDDEDLEVLMVMCTTFRTPRLLTIVPESRINSDSLAIGSQGRRRSGRRGRRGRGGRRNS